ncbi:MAG: ABC transporter substrate-binding protein [Bdellovibrionales bacterium]|nr:ABC transporter substrate-binding protein [Bdellovibrionales bacterium]
MRSSKFIFLAFLSVVSLFGFSNCSFFGPKNEITIGTLLSIRSIDPVSTTTFEQDLLVGAIYETLVKVELKGGSPSFEPNLLERLPITNDGGLNWQLQIRSGIKFQKSECFVDERDREFTSRDVAFSLSRGMHGSISQKGSLAFGDRLLGLKEWASAEKPDWSNLPSGIQVTNSTTLNLKFSKPFPDLIRYLVSPNFSILSEKCMRVMGFTAKHQAVGTGPFKLSDFGKTITLERNTDYRDARFPNLDKITFKSEVSNNDGFLGAHSGEIDLHIMNPHLYQGVTKNGALLKDWERAGFSILSWSKPAVTYLAFNMDNGELQNQPQIRKAMWSALESKEVFSSSFGEMGQPTQTFVPQSISGLNTPLVPRDLEKGKQLLKEAGFSDSNSPPLVYLEIDDTSISKLAGNILVDRLKMLGTPVSVRTNNWTDLFKRIGSKNYTLMLLTWNFDWLLPGNVLGTLYGKEAFPIGSNTTYFNNPLYNQWYEKLLSDGSSNVEAIQNLEKIIQSENPVIPLFNSNVIVAANSWVKDVDFSAFRYDALKDLSLDLKERKALKAK